MGAKLNRLGIEKVKDLLMCWPRAYQDYTNISKIADISYLKPQISNLKSLEGSTVTIRARIVGIGNRKTRRRGFTVTEAVVEDGTGSIKVVWFNQLYLVKMLRAGSELILNGKISLDPYSGELVMESPNRADRPKIVPVYGETAGLSSYFIARQITNHKSQIAKIKEFLPEKVIEQNKLLGIQEAILNIHEPANSEMLEKARERLAFDELFLMALRAQLSKVSNDNKIAPKIEIGEKLLKDFTKDLPFELTEDQKVSAWKIIQDMKGDILPSVIARSETVAISDDRLLRKVRNDNMTRPMNRLLNGDVGCGKTVVAAFAAYVAIKAGYRAVMMAPTEILAQQHFATCCDILSAQNISVGLITSSQIKFQNPNTKYQIKSKAQNPKSEKLEAKSSKLETERADLVIGTHALLQDKVEIQNVGLVVVDEQHRFGVRQRAALQKITNHKSQITNKDQISNSKNENPNKLKSYKLTPHYLSMTATPIPRTLYLALFADLDLSVIKEMPKGRKEIKTRLVPEANRDKAYQFIRKQIESGRQAFVICPLIEEKISNSKNSNEANSANKASQANLFEQDRKSVIAEYQKLNKNIFPDLRIGMLHGRMKAKEKEAIMADFSAKGKTSPKGGKARKIDILVSTSVVEVGVDIPNAAIIIIEDAERFGLAQLHQFRGRVGRAEHQSYCFLFSNSKNPIALKRLEAMEETNDGFKLAEIDLKNRGAGDIFGVMQSGDINLKMASLSDRILIEKASNAAREIVAEGISRYPMLIEKAKAFEASRHLE